MVTGWAGAVAVQLDRGQCVWIWALWGLTCESHRSSWGRVLCYLCYPTSTPSLSMHVWSHQLTEEENLMLWKWVDYT